MDILTGLLGAIIIFLIGGSYGLSLGRSDSVETGYFIHEHRLYKVTEVDNEQEDD